DNTLLNYQNGIIPQTPVTYNPYATGQSVSNDIPVAYADFSTSRLIVGGNCVLSVKKKVNSQVVLSIPVVDYLLYGKGENSSMTDQNYIDQQNQWSITLYIQESFWVNTHVKINDWEFRLNDAKL
ncbi:MAG: FimB/Mfa2 family fimbrial subunit, partial [Muribaculaceae bacterium]|nr:FimB/Mfa2 family fimbrial subunit [Muribaculaceae bacterium]